MISLCVVANVQQSQSLNENVFEIFDKMEDLQNKVRQL